MAQGSEQDGDATSPLRTALIALGGNVAGADGAPDTVLGKAVGEIGAQLQAEPADIRLARFYRTPAYPPGSGPDYVNSALSLVTRHAAGRILAALHEVEATFGRVRAGRWGARTLDLDLIAVDGEVAPDATTLRRWIDLPPERQTVETPDRLLLPHPRMQDRAFVLVPLADVAPDWTHPLLGLSVARMLARLPAAERDAVVPLRPETQENRVVNP